MEATAARVLPPGYTFAWSGLAFEEKKSGGTSSLVFAVGCLPLALALGAGSNARHSIGTGIIGGMIGETTLAMLYVPLLFYLFDRFAERKGG